MGLANPKYKRVCYSKTNAGQESNSHSLSLKETISTYRSMNLPYAEIASKLNSRGLTTVRGKQFAAMTVHRLCQKLGV